MTPLELADSLVAVLDAFMQEVEELRQDGLRIANEIKAISVAPPDGQHWLEYPLDFRPVTVTGEFGVKDKFYTWVHEGIDLSAPVGYPVRACHEGKVIFAGVKDGYGNCVRLEHVQPVTGEKWWTWYGHLNIVSVLAWSRVKSGDMIGLSGNSGNTTGPHLHLGVQRETNTFQPPTWSVNLRGSVNPREFVKLLA